MKRRKISIALDQCERGGRSGLICGFDQLRSQRPRGYAGLFQQRGVGWLGVLAVARGTLIYPGRDRYAASFILLQNDNGGRD